MIVVADTSVILNLCRVQCIPGVKTILQRLETEAGFWIAPGLRKRVRALADGKI